MEEWEAGRRKPPEYIPRLKKYQIMYEQQFGTQNKKEHDDTVWGHSLWPQNEYTDCRLEVAICDFKNGLEDSMAKDNSELIDVNSDVKDRVMEVSHIQSLIYVIRGKQVMLDSDLAILY